MKMVKSRRFSAVLCTALAISALGVSVTVARAGPLPGPWRFWRYSRAILFGSIGQEQMTGVVPPLEVFAHAQPQLADIRVIDDQAREIPYVLFARFGSTARQMRSTRTLETSFAPGQFTQVVLDLGEKPPFHNSVAVVTPEQDFMTWVEVAVSDDARPQWRIVRDRAGIFRFHQQALEGNQTLSYSDSNARYLRLRFLGGQKQFPVTSAQVAYDATEAAERAAAPVALAPDSASAPAVSSWRADLGTPNLPIAEVRFEVAQPAFNRSVSVFASTDGESWHKEAHGKIYRFRQNDLLEESLCFSFPEVQGMRYWRVQVENGNDPPLAGARPALYTTPRHIIFRQEPGRSYRLLYGQSEAKAPQYELGRLANRKDIESAAAGSLGSEEVNTSQLDPRPWTEQHPAVLWTALGVAIILLAFSALRALRGE